MLGIGRILLVAVAVATAAAATAGPRIPRDPGQVRAFRAEHPCPATHRVSGPCRGWQVDHIRPLCAGGLDRPENMHWLATDDHRWKTFVDVRECRKLRRNATRPTL